MSDEAGAGYLVNIIYYLFSKTKIHKHNNSIYQTSYTLTHGSNWFYRKFNEPAANNILLDV